MPTLVVAATAMEIELFKAVSKRDETIHTLVAGIGMTEMAINLSRHLSQHNYDRVILAGIAGSFGKIALCEVVEVISQQYGDLGVETSRGFLSLKDMELSDEIETITNSPYFTDIKGVSSISVNTVSGSATLIEERKKLFQTDIEVMEGIAAAKTCYVRGISFTEVRSISNYVEERNRESWKVKEAIAALNEFLIQKLL